MAIVTGAHPFITQQTVDCNKMFVLNNYIRAVNFDKLSTRGTESLRYGKRD